MTTYSLQLSGLFVSSGLPVGLHFLLQLHLFKNILCLFPCHLLLLVQFVKAVTSCQLTVKKTAKSSPTTAPCDSCCSSSNFCSIHACEVTFNLSISKPTQIEDCTTNTSVYLDSIAGNSAVEAPIAVLERVLTCNDYCSLFTCENHH
jgi:hypothetical protein